MPEDARCDTPGPGTILGPCARPPDHQPETLHVGLNGLAWETAPAPQDAERTHPRP